MTLSTASKKINTAESGRAALQAFFAISQAWKLTNDEARKLLGDPPNSTFYSWKGHPDRVLSKDTLERISYLLGIYKALRLLLPTLDAAHQWPRKPNRQFGGRSALELMLQGRVMDLARMREYLDAERGAYD